MREVEQVIIALIIDLSKGPGEKKYRGPLKELRAATVGSYGLEKFIGSFDTALDFLIDLGIANVHSYPGVEDYVSVDASSTVQSVLLGRIVKEKVAGDADDFSFDPADSELRYPILATYLDVGFSWLHDFALSLKNETPAAEQSYASSTWTGRYVVSEESKVRISELLREMRLGIEKTELSNAERSNALSALSAIEALSNAANPAWALILRILQSPALANVAALAALAISLIKA